MMKLLTKVMLRNRCSQCNKPGIRIDDRNFQCKNGHGAWDGASEFEQQKVLIKEINTKARDY